MSLKQSKSSINKIRGKKILITGAAGSIGSELVRQLVSDNEIYMVDIKESELFDLLEEFKLKDKKIHAKLCNIRDFDAIDRVIKTFWPDIIFHAAAYKHVTLAEADPWEYIQTNEYGTRNVLEAGKGVEKIINISTDKVINNYGVMGSTKRTAEYLTKSYNRISVRFGNVLWSNGSVMKIWARQIANNEPLTVTHREMYRYVMTIPQACELLVEAAIQGTEGDLFIMDMGEPVSILDLAKEEIKKSGKNLEVKFIGIRSGEVLTEKLMTAEEESIAVKKGKFWIISDRDEDLY